MVNNIGFNTMPVVEVQGHDNGCYNGWEAIGLALKKAHESGSDSRSLVAVETYQGVNMDLVRKSFLDILQPDLFIDTSGLFRDELEIRQMTQPDVTDDRVFGYLTRLNMMDFFDKGKFEWAKQNIRSTGKGRILVFGYGASLVAGNGGILIYADMARWEIQHRMRANEVSNLGISNQEESFELKYKRGYFLDWRVCDRLKKRTMERWDYWLDTNQPGSPGMVRAGSLLEAFRQTVRRPFSLAPFFDPGPWGGQWMKEKFGLNDDVQNYAWCFNCIPEENSLLLRFGDTMVESPAINLVFYQAAELLGDPVHARFGDEFPIRFDFLDTMEGGNLSLQVHPLTTYIQEKFGMHYTQDESYYLMDAGINGSVFLGLKEGVDRDRMISELKRSESEGKTFDVERFVEKWPANKHDHFLIPAGTVHCSGTNSMVLEISATPYIFTFKLYDWDRLNLDGKPRPINVEHGIQNIQWNRTRDWTKRNLVNRVKKIAEGDGWIEERTGLHEREFIETRRHWFTGAVNHHTGESVNVLNLVEGDQITVESPDNAFDPFIVNYAETFIVPACVGAYTIRPTGISRGKTYATIKAFVRHKA